METVKKTNFDTYLEENLKDPEFAVRFADAGEAWDIAIHRHENRAGSEPEVEHGNRFP